MNRTLSIVYATSTGHTEFVVDEVIKMLEKNARDIRVIKQRAEVSKPENLTKSDILILACGTWNTGNTEGQLNPHMHALLLERAASVSLGDMPVAAIGLGDERYHFTARAVQKLTEYFQSHGGSILVAPLKIVNEPFDQTAKIDTWAKELLAAIKKIKRTVVPHD